MNKNVYLESIRINGYRSCRTTLFNPNKQLSALIGINGAGKTNILNAIQLLNSESTYRWARSSSGNKDSLATATILTAWFSVLGIKIGLRLSLMLGTSSRGNDEILSCKEMWNFPGDKKIRTWFELPGPILFKGTNSSYKRYTGTYYYVKSPRRSGSFTYAAKYLPSLDKKSINALRLISEFRSGIKYYSASQFTNPTRCPSSFEIDSDGQLESSPTRTSSHLTFLHDLFSLRRSNKDLYNEYINFISRKQLGLISRLTWKEIRLSSHIVDDRSSGKIRKVKKYKTLVIPRIQIGSSHISFNQLSEGTFKTLAIIFYLMTDTSTCLLIEEPEVCVHHGLLTKILGTIKSYSTSKQIMFSTHSDLVLDTISHEDVFVVQMTKSGTKSSSLSKWAGKKGLAALKVYLDETGTLGEYWRSGGLAS